MVASSFFNRVVFVALNGGTGRFTVNQAAPGARTPAQAGVSNGTIISYTAVAPNLTQWECGQGVYNNGTLTRVTLRGSSTGSFINFTLPPTVQVDCHAEDLSSFSAGQGAQSVVNDTNVTGSIANTVLTLGWAGTLAAARLNANVVQSVVNDTNVTGSIATQALTLGWTGRLALSRLTTGTAGYMLQGNGVSDPQYAGFLQSGTGAITRTWQNKVQETVSVTDFGAVGNGVTDNTTTINLAIAALNAGTISALYFPAGVYVISAALTTITHANVALFGDDSQTSIISQSTNNDTLTFASTSPSTTQLGDVSVSNLGIEQTAVTAPSAGVALTLKRVTRGHFQALDIRNVYSGLLIEGGNDQHYDSLSITGAFTWSSLASGSFLVKTRLLSGTTDLPTEILFDNFNIKGVTSSGPANYLNNAIVIEAGDGLFFSDGHCGFANEAALGINAQNNANAPIVSLEFSNVYFDGNFAGSASSALVSCAGSTTPTVANHKYIGCVFKNGKGHGINYSLSTMSGLIIDGGLIADNGAYGTIINTGTDIIFSNSRVSGNNINNSGANAVSLFGVTKTNLIGNQILAGANIHTIGLEIDGSCVDTMVSGNTFEGHTTSVSDSGTNTVANYNIGWNYGQIKFPAAQNSSSNANTLDDYEEGQTTPVVTAGSGTFTTVSCTIDYTKVGRLVTCGIIITITTAGSAASFISVPLPFTAASNGGGCGLETQATGVGILGSIQATAGAMLVNRYDGNTIIADGRTIRMSATYMAAT